MAKSATLDVSSPFLRQALRLQGIVKGASQAVARAKGTLARRIPVEARRDMQNEYALPASRINQGLSVKNNSDGVTLIASSAAIGLISFGGKWGGPKTAGAVAQIFNTEAAHMYGGTFIATGRSGNRQIFSRKFVGGHRAGRLPLAATYGPSVAGMLRKGDREERLGEIASSIMSDEIQRLLISFP